MDASKKGIFAVRQRLWTPWENLHISHQPFQKYRGETNALRKCCPPKAGPTHLVAEAFEDLGCWTRENPKIWLCALRCPNDCYGESFGAEQKKTYHCLLFNVFQFGETCLVFS